MKDIKEILSGLSNFKSPLFKQYEGVSIEKISHFETKIGFELPKDFKEFLLATNGCLILCSDLYGIYDDKRAFDLYRNYLYEKDEVGNPILEYLLPMYPDGMGNHYCLNLKELNHKDKTCSVVFWQHDRLYENKDRPEVVANSFTEFLEDLLEEMTKLYNFDGTNRIDC